MRTRRKPPPSRNDCDGASRRIVASIDLHGYRKSEAISRLTEFLDQTTRKYNRKGGPCWVEVITGSGAHSIDGPVIRPAVQALLEQRQMIWQVKGTGNACFLVDAASGIVLFEPDQPRDSKVILTDSSSLFPDHSMSGRWSSASAILRKPTTESSNSTSSEVEGEAEAIRQSTKALKKEFDKRRKEEHALERAMSMSRCEAIRKQEEEEKMMKRIVSMSILDNKQALEDEESLQRAVELSKQELDAVKEADAAFHQVIELSRREQELYRDQVWVTDDTLLHQAMALSQQEYQRENDARAKLLRALEQSEKDEHEIDDAELVRVLKQSVVDF
ncbi:Smr domain containing protein [Nitzschia inconspicua]|uniref:Smr domain containing protein n=1 Tax=Nitzschia inconspicua TaxID=303405 RepID=A0A9K3LMQ3_9STRA|nr:Smr domain containing protein [Nitzschia inconspicua]